MEHELWDELEDCRYLVTWDFCRVIVSCIDGEHHIVFGCVCSVEIV